MFLILPAGARSGRKLIIRDQVSERIASGGKLIIRDQMSERIASSGKLIIRDSVFERIAFAAFSLRAVSLCFSFCLRAGSRFYNIRCPNG